MNIHCSGHVVTSYISVFKKWETLWEGFHLYQMQTYAEEQTQHKTLFYYHIILGGQKCDVCALWQST
jgi:hypothetical protein